MPPLKFKLNVNPYFFRPASKGFYSQSTLILFNLLSPFLLHSFPFSPQIPKVFLALVMFSLKPIYLLAFFFLSLFIFSVHTKILSFNSQPLPIHNFFPGFCILNYSSLHPFCSFLFITASPKKKF